MWQLMKEFFITNRHHYFYTTDFILNVRVIRQKQVHTKLIFFIIFLAIVELSIFTITSTVQKRLLPLRKWLYSVYTKIGFSTWPNDTQIVYIGHIHTRTHTCAHTHIFIYTLYIRKIRCIKLQWPFFFYSCRQIYRGMQRNVTIWSQF